MKWVVVQTGDGVEMGGPKVAHRVVLCCGFGVVFFFFFSKFVRSPTRDFVDYFHAIVER